MPGRTDQLISRSNKHTAQPHITAVVSGGGCNLLLRRLVMRFTELEKAEVWDRWQGGKAMRSIARRLGRESSSVRTMIEDTGGCGRCRGDAHPGVCH